MRSGLAAGISGLLASTPCFAETISRSYQAVMHVREAQSKPVLDRPDHVIGIGAFRGLAVFQKGDVAVHRYDGWFDLKKGSGKFHGYALWKWEDGSELRAAYDGFAERSDTHAFQVKARFYNFAGAGRYAGVSGDGSFEGAGTRISRKAAALCSTAG